MYVCMTCLGIFPDFFFFFFVARLSCIVPWKVKKEVLIKDLHYKYFVAWILGYQL